ncbi:hypothetical protein QI633_11275 [Nocardioides sp. QY071]|uniref:hypothetical protein n=1 Tax=Nocardioides sp. QY071 TaxID=3044187 RepID=UPI00249A776A|nr:hypothetical protein [Nocardioides sp. QY071]WGY04327.1 hypothetical protein QI633_11275 [Nocardioides sp. QY071]
MSERRRARARTEHALTVSGGLPACLVIGRCIEVWVGGHTPTDPLLIRTQHEVRRRFGIVRSWWLEQQGIPGRDGWSIIPSGHTWSADFLIEQGRRQWVDEYLARAGCKLSDVPALASDANRLWDLASPGSSIQSLPEGASR